jgi:hypothetical protein
MHSIAGHNFSFEKKNLSIQTILICFFLQNINYKCKLKSLSKHLIINYVNK